jgi:3-mercaptopyruvate sulfurtransferase SseA
MNITVDELLQLGENGATIVNAGKHAGRREIRGAIRYEQSDLVEALRLTLPIATDKPVIVYGESDPDETLEKVAANFRQSGFADVRLLSGGFKAYEDAGAPLQEASIQQEVPPHKLAEVQAFDKRL